MRRIVHLDMDAFYASVEQRDQPALRGKPVVVGGSADSRGVVAAASYEARRYGVRSAMPMARAERLCPGLVRVPADFAKYRRESETIMEILRSCTPLVEPLSLDEAYLDVTENAWGEAYATRAAKRLKEEIRQTTGLTASAGVAPNKFLAKIASGWRKPDGLTVIPPERIEDFLQELPVEALWGVGPVTAGKLRALGIARLVDVRAASPDVLRRSLGSMADELRELAYGRDDRPVQAHRERKSGSSENTYAEDLTDLETIRGEVSRMAEEMADWLGRKGLTARTVTLKVRYAGFITVTRSHTLSFPTREPERIAAWALQLLARTQAGARPVRLLGVGVHSLLPEELTRGAALAES